LVEAEEFAAEGAGFGSPRIGPPHPSKMPVYRAAATKNRERDSSGLKA